MNEELSALVDGELDGGSFSRQMVILEKSAEARADWDNCQLIGDALRGHLSPGICTRVAERLAAEPTVLAPKTTQVNLKSMGGWAMSLAAGAAAMALVVWTVLPELRANQQLAQQAPDRQVPVATAASSSQVADYLLAHQRYSVSSAMQGVAPYVRTVAQEQEQ